MISFIIFVVSGLAILLLLTAKKLGERGKRYFFVLGVISKGDARIRVLYHHAVRLYSEGREQFLFAVNKQIPIHSKNFFNKFITFLRKKREQYMISMRDSRLLKKSDGISEFFKNMSEIEKGNGEIHDSYEDARQDTYIGLGSQDGKKELE